MSFLPIGGCAHLKKKKNLFFSSLSKCILCDLTKNCYKNECVLMIPFQEGFVCYFIQTKFECECFYFFLHSCNLNGELIASISSFTSNQSDHEVLLIKGMETFVDSSLKAKCGVTGRGSYCSIVLVMNLWQPSDTQINSVCHCCFVLRPDTFSQILLIAKSSPVLLCILSPHKDKPGTR